MRRPLAESSTGVDSLSGDDLWRRDPRRGDAGAARPDEARARLVAGGSAHAGRALAPLSSRTARHRPSGCDEARALRRHGGAAHGRPGLCRRADRPRLRLLVRRHPRAAAASLAAPGAGLGTERKAEHLRGPEPGRRGLCCGAGHRSTTHRGHSGLRCRHDPLRALARTGGPRPRRHGLAAAVGQGRGRVRRGSKSGARATPPCASP